MITGNMKPVAKTGTFTLNIATMLFDIANLRVTPNDFKSQENHPDYIIECRTPRGNYLRVGSMWKAGGAHSGHAYYSISVTDRNGKTWRMNAVRNDTTPTGEWIIVPLAGSGEPSPIVVGGTLEQTDDGALIGLIESYDFSMNVVLIPVEDKADDKHPDYRMEVTSPTGTVIRIGSAWTAMSERGNAYYSLSFYAPTGSQHRANAVKGEGTADGVFTVIKLAEQPIQQAA
jgi:uncharacterized protein (DUF736 family)